ncbi:MAG: hypothetical protein ACRER0_04485 [Gammaproteobacteria bacterium]
MAKQNQFEDEQKRMQRRPQRQFRKRTDDDAEQAVGESDGFVYRIQERYGDSKEDAIRRLYE